MIERLEIKRTPDGSILARRTDGRPLTSKDREEVCRVADKLESLPRAWVVEEVRSAAGRLQAVLICSALIEDHVWLILHRSFIPIGGLACYYPEELPELETKTPEELREIHAAKLAFPGARIVQEGAEKKADTSTKAAPEIVA